MTPHGTRVLRCDLCGALQSIAPLPAQYTAQYKAQCFRCASVLDRGKTGSLDFPLALSLAALILWVVANTLPFVTLEYGGIEQTNFLVTGAAALWRDGQYFLGTLVFLTSIAIPAIQIGLTCYLLGALRLGGEIQGLAPLARMLKILGPWAMSGVYLIGLLVAAVKLSQIASLKPGPGLYCFAALVLLWTLASTSVDLGSLGRRPQPEATRA